MTFGDWRERAHTSLRAAHTAIRGRDAVSAAAVYGLIAARSDVYHHLVRATELLLGGPPRADVQDHTNAATIMKQHGGVIALHAGLRSARLVAHPYPPAPADLAEPARLLRASADATGIMADILASHLPRNQRYRSPEGNAIRNGAGVRAGLADIANLTSAMLDVDRAFYTWLDRAHGPAALAYHAIHDATHSATNGRLDAAVEDVVAATGRGHPVLRALDFAAVPLSPSPTIRSARDAATTTVAVRSWLTRNPDAVTVAHIQAVTQLGLAIRQLDGDPDANRWRKAAIAATKLRGTPPTGQAHDAASQLVAVLRWTRAQPPAHTHGHAPDLNISRLRREGQALATALRSGLRSAMLRNDIFVPAEAVLRRVANSPILMAVPQQWRPANNYDILHIDDVLQQPEPDGSTFLDNPAPAASRAFQQPPTVNRSAATTPLPSTPAAPPTTAPTRGRAL